MKKIVYTIFWILILWIIAGKNSFVYAQTEEKPINTSEYGIIRIKDPNNPWKWITILDRNLWATATWAWVDESRESFWYYYQWWNNYGFSSDPDAIISTTWTQIDASWYWPNTLNGYYSSDTFIVWNDDWSNVRNDNLRWWANDSQSNNRWLDLNNQKDRQWPCPDNYHIPSIGERNKLLEFWAEEYGNLSLEMESNGLYKFQNNPTAADSFYQRFYLTFAGQRNHNSYIINAMGMAILRSSSPNSSIYTFRLYWNANNIFAQDSDRRAFAFPIRCFYDSDRLPVKITYDVNWWYWVGEENKVLQRIITYTRDDDSWYSWDIALWKVRKDNCWNGSKMCMFGWWYTTDDELWTWNISEDITLYAKWLAYEDKYISLSGVNFNIMDRNLWSENSWTDEDTYGYYLTWWEGDILCPEWYHIPDTWEWIWIKNLLGEDFNSDLIKSLLNLPFAGKLENGVVVDWENGYYLTKNGDEIMYAKISNSGIETKDLSEWEKVSVRCFKDYNNWIIKFDSKWWNDIPDMETVNWWKDWENLDTPNREHSVFLWWYDQDNIKTEKNINYKNENEINLYGKWECEVWYQEKGDKCKRISGQSGWSSRWGSRWNNKDSQIQSWANWNEGALTGQSIIPMDLSTETSGWQNNNILSWFETENPRNTIEISPSTDIFKLQWYFSQEFVDAYNFAYKNWITTKSSIYDAKMYSPLTRIQMAKMLSNYAINVLWKEPDVSKWVVKFDDVSNNLNKEYGNAVILAYQLWIMWQNIKNNKFKPYNEVTRAEFATALSRLLYWTEDWKNKYYDPHIIKLYGEWIINKTDPLIKEKRGYVMIMLLRYTQ